MSSSTCFWEFLLGQVQLTLYKFNQCKYAQKPDRAQMQICQNIQKHRAMMVTACVKALAICEAADRFPEFQFLNSGVMSRYSALWCIIRFWYLRLLDLFNKLIGIQLRRD